MKKLEIASQFLNIFFFNTHLLSNRLQLYFYQSLKNKMLFDVAY